MQWRGTYKHKAMCTGNDEYCAGSTPKSKESTRSVIPKDLLTFPKKKKKGSRSSCSHTCITDPVTGARFVAIVGFSVA